MGERVGEGDGEGRGSGWGGGAGGGWWGWGLGGGGTHENSSTCFEICRVESPNSGKVKSIFLHLNITSHLFINSFICLFLCWFVCLLLSKYRTIFSLVCKVVRFPYWLSRVALISNFHRVLNVECFLLGNSGRSELYIPTFRNILSVPSSYIPSYEDGTDTVFRNVGI